MHTTDRRRPEQPDHPFLADARLDGLRDTYMGLRSFDRGGGVFMAVGTLAGRLGVCESTAHRHIRRLKDHGVLEVKPRFLNGRQRTNLYLFPTPDWWVEDQALGGVQRAVQGDTLYRGYRSTDDLGVVGYPVNCSAVVGDKTGRRKRAGHRPAPACGLVRLSEVAEVVAHFRTRVGEATGVRVRAGSKRERGWATTALQLLAVDRRRLPDLIAAVDDLAGRGALDAPAAHGVRVTSLWHVREHLHGRGAWPRDTAAVRPPGTRLVPGARTPAGATPGQGPVGSAGEEAGPSLGTTRGFAGPDAVERRMGARVEGMTPRQLVDYVRGHNATRGIDLPPGGHPEVAVFRALQKRYGPEVAGRLVKWAFYKHAGKFRGEPIGVHHFGASRPWFCDKLAAGVQEHVRARAGAATASSRQGSAEDIV